MKKRNFLTALCSILALSCVSLGGITAKTNASAATTTTFEMKYGASARTVSGESGLRFQAIVDETTANAVVADTTRSFGMIIVPTDYLEGITDNFVPQLETVCTTKGVKLTQIETNADGEEIAPYLDDEDGNYYFNGVIDVSYENTNRDFTGIAYIKTTGDSVSYEYAAFSKAEDGTGVADVKNNSRSIAEIASAALNETREEYKLTGTRREVCVSYVNDALTRAAKAEQGSAIDGLFAIDGEGALAPNGEETLALATTADLRLNWSSSDETVATVDGGKVMVGAYVGQATITASIGNDETTDFAATKDVTSKASEGTFKWTENSISTVATGYDALGTSNEYPAKLAATTVGGVNVVEITRGIVNASSTPAIMFNDADCFFDLNAGSVISFKVGLSEGFYSEGYGGVAITYKDAPSPLASGSKTDATVATFNEKLYVSATSDSADLTLDYAITTVNGTRQVLYKAALVSTTLTETTWVNFTLYFPNDTAATLENLQIAFGSYNFQVNNTKAGVCDNTKIYVSEITVDNVSTFWDSAITGVSGIDEWGTSSTYPASTSVEWVDGQRALKVSYSNTFATALTANNAAYCLPGIKFADDCGLTLTKGATVSFKIRLSDDFFTHNQTGGVYITYGEKATDGLGSAISVSSTGTFSSDTATGASSYRMFNDTRTQTFAICGAASAGDCGEEWVTVMITFNTENPTLEGLRIMYATGHGTSSPYTCLGKYTVDTNAWIYISDLTVTNP